METPAHVNEIVFEGDAIKIGRWRLPAAHPRFRDSGPTKHYLVVFPRTSAWIGHAGSQPFVADASLVTYYNRDQEYTRGVIAPAGDWCEYYAVDPGLLRQVVAEWDPAATDRPHRILGFSHGPSDTQAYLTQRSVYSHVRSNPAPDPLFVEETMIGVLARVIGLAYAEQRVRPADRPDVVEHTREIIARRYASPLTLAALASETNTSVFHLCRMFRARTGTTIHAYRNQLRLRAALHALLDSRADLTDVALALGYSSHSHFTAAFGAAYGVTPSLVRRANTCRRMPPSTSFRDRSTAPRTGAPCRRRDATT
jgi:AraC-like DNA-binding protein